MVLIHKFNAVSMLLFLTVVLLKYNLSFDCFQKGVIEDSIAIDTYLVDERDGKQYKIY